MKLFSRLQFFFWLVVGSEIHILKECKTDYNRHATLGLVLFMTTLVAMTSGFSAGYYFSHGDNRIACLFSLLWACLIYAIDRSMIMSLKKKKAIEEATFKDRLKHFVLLISSRAVIGITIAFFMSIPLELYVFQDCIRIQLDKDNDKEALAAKQRKEKIGDLASKEADKGAKKNEVEKMEVALNGTCPIPDYVLKMNTYTDCADEAKVLQKNYEKVEIPTRYALLENGASFETSAYRDAIAKKNKLKIIYQNKSKICNGYKVTADSINGAWRTTLFADKKKATQVINSLDSNINNVREDADNAQKAMKLKTAKADGFARQFTALEHASHDPDNGYLLFLLWLIRIVFIGLEILPTLVKVTTPVGEYDIAIESKEREFAIQLAANEVIRKSTELTRTETEILIYKDIEMVRQVKEKELNEKIVIEIILSQEKIAKAILQEWELREQNKLKQSMTHFIDKQ